MANNEKMTTAYRFWVMGILVLGCVGLEYYFHAVRGTTIVYTHLFYIPIAAAAFWWGMKAGLPVSLFFGLMHMALSFPDIEESVLFRSLALVFVGSVIGITSDMRRRAEDASRRSRRNFKEIFQEIGQPSIILDPQHRIMSANRNIMEISGRSEEELIGKKCFEIFHGTDQPPEGCPLEKIRISGQRETAIMEVEALNRPFLVSCTPMLDDSGRLEQVVHIATDMTGLRRAEQMLKESEEKYRILFERSTDAIYITAQDGKFVDFNKSMLDLLGYAGEEMMGLKAQDTYAHPRDRNRFQKEI
ncbi:MAG: PAS domain-containing protein, partial [Thermodesulfobacteriota bacterium]|nr:PAS domain-containing protein [Thermodesulfobacteriota bacterium]